VGRFLSRAVLVQGQHRLPHPRQPGLSPLPPRQAIQARDVPTASSSSSQRVKATLHQQQGSWARQAAGRAAQRLRAWEMIVPHLLRHPVIGPDRSAIEVHQAAGVIAMGQHQASPLPGPARPGPGLCKASAPPLGHSQGDAAMLQVSGPEVARHRQGCLIPGQDGLQGGPGALGGLLGRRPSQGQPGGRLGLLSGASPLLLCRRIDGRGVHPGQVCSLAQHLHPLPAPRFSSAGQGRQQVPRPAPGPACPPPAVRGLPPLHAGLVVAPVQDAGSPKGAVPVSCPAMARPGGCRSPAAQQRRLNRFGPEPPRLHRPGSSSRKMP